MHSSRFYSRQELGMLMAGVCVLSQAWQAFKKLISQHKTAQQLQRYHSGAYIQVEASGSNNDMKA